MCLLHARSILTFVAWISIWANATEACHIWSQAVRLLWARQLQRNCSFGWTLVPRPKMNPCVALWLESRVCWSAAVMNVRGWTHTFGHQHIGLKSLQPLHLWLEINKLTSYALTLCKCSCESTNTSAAAWCPVLPSIIKAAAWKGPFALHNTNKDSHWKTWRNQWWFLCYLPWEWGPVLPITTAH